jgi:hypothetical protein
MTGSFEVDFVPAGLEIRRLRQPSEISLGVTFVLTPPVDPELSGHTVPGIVAFTTPLWDNINDFGGANLPAPPVFWPNGIFKNESIPLEEENPWYVIFFSWSMAIGFFDPVVLRVENIAQITRPVIKNSIYAMVSGRIAVWKYFLR